MTKKPSLTLIGAGNLGTSLVHSLHHAGYWINEVYSQELKNAQTLASNFPDSNPVSELDFSQSTSELFFLTTRDEEAIHLLAQLKLPPGSKLFHTSGSLPLSILDKKATSIGVLYPIQTFSKSKVIPFRDLKVCIESNNEPGLESLRSICNDMETEHLELNSEQRKVLHMSAVFACNFTNHLFILASEILKTKKLEFALINPLIQETIDKAFEIGPENAQTGPAKRGDETVIQDHLELLKDHKVARELYLLHTESIMSQVPEN